MTLEKLMKKSLDHYDRMIKYVETFLNLNKIPTRTELFKYIKEDWGARHCSYCKEFFEPFTSLCKECILSSGEYDHGYSHCCDGLWSCLDGSETWDDWVFFAKQVRDYIEKNGLGE